MDDTYLKESCKSYQKCQIANSARRNSLMKRTVGIEAERKLASHMLNREERQLREQLKNMRIEQAKTTNRDKTSEGQKTKDRKKETDGLQIYYTYTKARKHKQERANSDSKINKPCPPSSSGQSESECIDPYPVTFPSKGSPRPPHRERSRTMVEKAGRRYAARRRRRVSKEFEDLSLNTTTGNLAIPFHLLLPHSGSRSPSSPTTPSPTFLRRGINGSHSSLDSAEGSHWAGDPEAIQSVRRPRKSVGQQEKEKLLRMKGEASLN